MNTTKPAEKPKSWDTFPYWKRAFPKLSPCAQAILRHCANVDCCKFPDSRNLVCAMKFLHYDEKTATEALSELSELHGIWLKKERCSDGSLHSLCIMKRIRLTAIQQVVYAHDKKEVLG